MLEPKAQKRMRHVFMVEIALLEKMRELVPSRRQNDFANEALEQGLTLISREKAFKELNRFKKSAPAIRKFKNDNELKKFIRKGLL